ncbi:poly(R)-hydroxyalkanoic acid synthase, class III, PhaE subunit [Mizugakiibacter sediminis]|uniref:Poly(3-hydroxyalkanoate) polymerase subunit PhaE n=1 Tax=Mizugakiibacter sediminis TaxID=1475481 RepID=A0A0K8QNY8_9GAMM|nr:class III poly(R)-hydroxyalkanoic acid synthase subunit PhaE [Mizugakiibacter sediminis]GAP66594.1 poly(R)-hydroxyalkanoic acid synthase, class III, PhaE subunit [Mizugakiibacter sediminis]
MTGPDGGFFKDYEALARQSWDAWSEYLRSAAGADGNGGSATVEQILAGLKGYFAWLETVAAATAGPDAGAWRDGLANALGGAASLQQAFAGLDGAGAQGFEAMLQRLQEAAAPWRNELSSWLRTPAFGFAREHQERRQKLAQAWLDCQTQLGRYQALIARANRLGAERLEAKLVERTEPGRQVDSLRALYDLWVDAAEEAYAEIALSPEFGEVYGALVDAQMRARALLQRETEEVARQLGMPTRSEVNAIGRRLQEMRREWRRRSDGAIAEEVAALRAEVAELRARIGKAPGTRKTSAARAPSARKPKPRKS